MSLEIILRAGLATGTILIFAAIGEILSERSGIMNLGVEGMMFWVPWQPSRHPYQPEMPGWVYWQAFLQAAC